MFKIQKFYLLIIDLRMFLYAVNSFISWEINTGRLQKNPCLVHCKICEFTRRKSGRVRIRKSASFGDMKAQSRSILCKIVTATQVCFFKELMAAFTPRLLTSRGARISIQNGSLI
jgi:hypothetical protein